MAESSAAGRWYLWVICRSCEEMIPIREVKPPMLLHGSGGNIHIEAVCRYCGAKHSYSLGEAQLRQADAQAPGTA